MMLMQAIFLQSRCNFVTVYSFKEFNFFRNHIEDNVFDEFSTVLFSYYLVIDIGLQDFVLLLAFKVLRRETCSLYWMSLIPALAWARGRRRECGYPLRMGPFQWPSLFWFWWMRVSR